MEKKVNLIFEKNQSLKMKTLKEIYKEFASPEGSGDKGTAHSYIDNYYNHRFDKIRHDKLNILEIGVSTGLSLQMWCEYFPNSKIIGVEIEKIDYQPANNRISILNGDATDSKTFNNVDNLDIIIDDGSHVFTDQIFSFAILYHKLNRGGIYIIEDVRDIDNIGKFFKRLNAKAKIFDFRNIKGRNDDVIVEIIK